MSTLRLHPGVRVIPARTGLFLRSDLTTFQVTGRDARAFLDRVLPLLDGTRDRAAIVAALGERSGALIDQLAARGLIEEGEGDAARRGQKAFLRAYPGDAEAREARLAAARVIVAGKASWGDAAARALVEAGIRVDRDSESPEGAALVIGALEPWDRAAIERISRAAQRAKVRSLWGRIGGRTLVLGPLVVPGETACRVCATAEIQPVQMLTEGRARAAEAALLGDLAALTTIKIITGYEASRLGGRVMVEDLLARTSEVATLVRLPWCPVCGEASR